MIIQQKQKRIDPIVKRMKKMKIKEAFSRIKMRKKMVRYKFNLRKCLSYFFQDVNINEFNSNFKSRKALKAVVNDESEPSSVSNLKRVANVLVLVLILLAFLDYFLSSNEFENVKQNVDLVVYSNRLLSEMQGMLAYLRDLKFMELGLYNSLATKVSKNLFLS